MSAPGPGGRVLAPFYPQAFYRTLLFVVLLFVARLSGILLLR